jgi:hypothetical protein
MSLFETPNVNSQSKTTDYTVLSTDDIVIFTLTAAATATLSATSGQYAGYVMSNRTGGQGIVYIQNAATSTANVTIAAGSGDAIFGTSTVSPGQIVRCSSNGAGIWTCGVAGTSGGGAGVQSKVVPLTSASILALNTTPLSLIASPGSGKATKVLNIGLKMTTTSTQYTGGGALEFRYTNGSGTKVSADIAAAVVTTTAGTSYTTVMGIEASLTLVTAAAVVVNAASADFAAGTGTGTFYLLYTTIG